MSVQPSVILFNKPFRVLCQFSPEADKTTLKPFIHTPKVYPAGRLDFDSEGLLLLTGNGRLQHWISDPKHKLEKTYWVQVEGSIDDQALQQLRQGVELKDGRTRPASATVMAEPANLWPREPPIRHRANVPTSWVELRIKEGRNRQVRRMTAAVGYPTLRLIRWSIGPWSLADLAPGQSRELTLEPQLWQQVQATRSPAKHHQRSKRS